MSELTPNNIPQPDKSVAEIHAEAIDKATKIYAMLKEAGYTAEDLAVTDFLINPHKPPHLCPPPKPPCPPPCPPKCEVAEYPAPRPIVHPHAPHKDHDHNMMPPCPMPEKPMPICPPPAPYPCKPQGAFPPYMQGGGTGVRPPMPNGGTAQRVAQADWNEANPFSASYIFNKPNVVLSINGEKPDPKTGDIKLDPKDLGMATLTNEELSGIINDVFHIFTVEKNNSCSCSCNG